jgi:hypothetical protein
MTSVSVVMAVHNGRRFLPEQLRSLLADLEPGDEVVIVDDASTDGSAAEIAALGDARIRLLCQATNRGVLRSFESVLAQARHEVLFLCDQDDVWLRGKRDRILKEFRADARVMAVVCDAEVIDEHGRMQHRSFMAGRGGFRGSVLATLWKNRYLGCAMALRRPLLRLALPIPASVPMHDMWLGAMAALHGRVRYVDQPLIRYRRHGGNLSPARRAGWGRMLAWRWNLALALATRWLAVATGRHRIAGESR